MLLAVDIGNSDITLGIHDETCWQYVWRVPSLTNKPELFYGLKISNFFLEANINKSQIAKVVISSVVPDLTERITNVTITLFGLMPIVLGVDLYKTLPVKVLNPYQIGADLVANALAAHTLFKKQCIIVDFGTALTFTTVSSEAEIVGVAIAPGLKTAIRSLSQNTAQLFDVPLEMPSSALGKNTVHAIQAGILFGYEGIVKNLLARIQAELDEETATVATGGLSSVIPSVRTLVDRIEPNLTLDGLRIVSTLVSQ